MIKTNVLPVFMLLSQMQSAEGPRIRASQSNPSQHYLLDFSILWEPDSTSSCVLGPNLIRPQLSKKLRAGILPSLQGKTASSIFPGLNSWLSFWKPRCLLQMLPAYSFEIHCHWILRKCPKSLRIHTSMGKIIFSFFFWHGRNCLQSHFFFLGKRMFMLILLF